jgi:AraC-like DNA-binding protein
MQSTKNITDKGIEFRIAKPTPQLSDFVESIWMQINHSETEKEIVVLPDGRFDIIFSYSDIEPYQVALIGLTSEPEQIIFPSKGIMFAISFKLLAIEYLLDMKAPSLLNTAHPLQNNFWGIIKNDLNDFESFCEKVSANMLTLIKPDIDKRKQKLFDLIYSSNGSLTVKELSEKIFWEERQINRYFNQFFGIPLKAYCNILRFRASFPHIKEGKLFPQQNYTDQAHFIREVKKLSGVIPKELSKNKNDRFIQFSTLPKK